MRVGDDRTRVVPRAQCLGYELVEAEPLRSGHLGRALQRGLHGGLGHRLGDVLGRHGLEEHVRYAYGVAARRGVGDALDELEELRRPDDRIGDPPLFDQLFLGRLRTEVAVVGQPLKADDRQRQVVGHARRGLGGQQVAGGGGEEVQHRRLLEGRRIGHVHDHLGSGERLGEALAGEGVDARMGRGGHRLVSAVREFAAHFAADEAGASDDHDLHVVYSLLRGPGSQGLSSGRPGGGHGGSPLLRVREGSIVQSPGMRGERRSGHFRDAGPEGGAPLPYGRGGA